MANGGSPGGPGSTCANTVCEAIEACCLPGGACKELPPFECEATGGKPLGPNSVCEGDADGNKIDDACERQACCLPNGECAETTPGTCREEGGGPLGVGTICLGDVDRNGIDDACDTDEPCEDCGPGPHWIDKCEPGFDGFP